MAFTTISFYWRPPEGRGESARPTPPRDSQSWAAQHQGLSEGIAWLEVLGVTRDTRSCPRACQAWLVMCRGQEAALQGGWNLVAKLCSFSLDLNERLTFANHLSLWKMRSACKARF